MEQTGVVGPGGRVRPRGNGMLGLRAVLVGLGALLGLLLLARGFVIIGGILLVMAVLRFVMLVRIHRDRARWHARRDAR